MLFSVWCRVSKILGDKNFLSAEVLDRELTRLTREEDQIRPELEGEERERRRVVQKRFVSGNSNMLVNDWYPQGGDDRGETPAGVKARLAVELINRARRFWHSSLSALFFSKINKLRLNTSIL